MMDIKQVLVQWFISFFNKNLSGGAVKNEIKPSQQLAAELQKPIVTKFEKRKAYSSFEDNI